MNRQSARRSRGVKGKAIRAWLLSGRSLTQREATTDFGYLHLGALVGKMRREGVPIKTQLISQDDGGAYARYYVDKSFMKDDKQLNLF